ncbi:tail fiber protein [Acinetobacter phage XC1]|nr:tail fiber protein [Acinetobacter phage XC1]
MTNPKLIATPFAENGDKNSIPETNTDPSKPQLASMSVGFPPITQQKISEGGIPPERDDFNGILNLYGQHLVHLNKGLPYEFDQDFANKIGGYPLNAILMLSNGDIVQSTTPNNVNNPNIDMTGWLNKGSNIGFVESIADLIAINNPHHGQIVYVMHFDKSTNRLNGGGLFHFDSSKTGINDGGLCINGWERVFNGDTINVDWFGADPTGTLNSNEAIQNAIYVSSPESRIFESIDKSNLATPKYSVEMSSGYYLLKNPLWIPPHIHFYGQGGAYYYENTEQKNQHRTYLVHDFSNKNQFVLKSINWKDDGTLINHEQLNISGTYSNSYKCRVHGFSIIGKNGWSSKVLGGISNYASARSSFYDMFITHIDVGAVFRDCFTALCVLETEHAKAGVLLKGNNNAFEIDAYVQGNPITKPISGSPFNKLLGDYEPSAFLSPQVYLEDNIFGVYSEYNQGIISPRIISENNDISVFNMQGNMNIDCLYSEINRYASFVALLSEIVIGDITGVLDNNSFELGLGGNITLLSDNQKRTTGSRVIRDDQYGGILNAPIAFSDPNKNGVFLNQCYTPSTTIYVNSVSGNDNLLGNQERFAVKSLDVGIYIAAKYGCSKIVILEGGNYNIAKNHTVDTLRIECRKQSSTSITTTGMIQVYGNLWISKAGTINANNNLITFVSNRAGLSIADTTINIGNGVSFSNSLWELYQDLEFSFSSVRFNYSDSGSKILFTPTSDNDNRDFFGIYANFKDCSSNDGSVRFKINTSDIVINRSNNTFKLSTI